MKDKLKALGEKALQIRAQLKTEEATKHALIVPFLMILGYDVYNPLEVVPEFTADTGVKKGEKVDYAIMQDGKPVILIECKHCDENLANHGNQLFRYYSVIPGKKIGILTNGYDYMLFADLESTNLKDNKPFFEFNITSLLDSQIEEIVKLQKSMLDMDKIVDTASVLKHTNDLKAVLRDELQNPSDDFITYLAKRVIEGPFTKNRFAFFEPLVRKSIKQVIDEIFTSRLNKALEQEKQEELVETLAEVEEEIATTAEELEAFGIVRAIGCSVIAASRIQHKDVKAYFGINIDGKAMKTFCRLRFGNRRKTINIIRADKTEDNFDLETIEGIYQYAEHIRQAIQSYEIN